MIKKKLSSRIAALGTTFLMMLTMTDLSVLGLSAAASDEVVSIADADDLLAFAERVNSGEYTLDAELTADITLDSSTNWTPIGDYDSGSSYQGTFDGNNHVISGMTCHGDIGCIGMFGYINWDGVVCNLGLEDGDFVGDGYPMENVYVGGIASYNYGTIENCYHIGDLSATGASGCYAGGIVAWNNGTVKNSYFMGYTYAYHNWTCQ